MSNNVSDNTFKITFSVILKEMAKIAQRAAWFSEQQIDSEKRNLPFTNISSDALTYYAYESLVLKDIKSKLPLKIDFNFSYSTLVPTNESGKLFEEIIKISNNLALGQNNDEFIFESDNSRISPLRSPFERLSTPNIDKTYRFRLPLKPFSVDSMFPEEVTEDFDEDKALQNYKRLYELLLHNLEKLCNNVKHESCNEAALLEKLDYLFYCIATNMPALSNDCIINKNIQEISLYDYTRVSSAFASCLYLYHKDDIELLDGDLSNNIENNKDIDDIKEKFLSDENKFLMIQCELSGIQKFIFASGAISNKKSTKLIRGRSFFVSLICECASQKLLRDLHLPCSCQIINAAGKFLILAPNTEEIKNKFELFKQEVQNYLYDKFNGEVCMIFATTVAKLADFESFSAENSKSEKDEQFTPFKNLMHKLHANIEKAKYKAFDLFGNKRYEFVKKDFFNKITNKGICCYDSKNPGEEVVDDSQDLYCCKLCKFIISLGENLPKNFRKQKKAKHYLGLLNKPNQLTSESEIFKKESVLGFYISFNKPKEEGLIHREYDISIADFDEPLFSDSSIPRKFISPFVPIYTDEDDVTLFKNFLSSNEYKNSNLNELKTWEAIATTGITLKKASTDSLNGEFENRFDALGQKALFAVKGDIDNLGMMFATGCRYPNFTQMLSLSRQVNNFFTVWFPSFCNSTREYNNVYTVFSGGDDFFFIGPWRVQINLIKALKDNFNKYVCDRSSKKEEYKISYSVGTFLFKHGIPISHIARISENNLEKAKSYSHDNEKEPTKDAVSMFGVECSNYEFQELLNVYEELKELVLKFKLSVGFIYNLQELVKKASNSKSNPEDAIWYSWLTYRCCRHIEQNKSQIIIDESEYENLSQKLHEWIEKYKEKMRIPLSIYLYENRFLKRIVLGD